MNIAVLGAGAWGTALAAQAALRHRVLLWGRDAAQLAQMAASRRNQRYLPDIELPASLGFEADLGRCLSAVGEEGLVVIATPMASLRAMLQQMPPQARVLWLCKGFEAETGLLGHEVAQALRPGAPSGVLSGPSFAEEVARGQPTALVAASLDAALGEAMVQAFHSDSLRVYTSADPVGVEVGGAVKNVLAIATGLCDGLAQSGAAGAPGLNARAALVTRGLAEMTRLGVALGARPDTFMGLSGLGDLVLTATGHLSRNRKVGLLLAEGLPLDRILAELGHVAEGVYSARTVCRRAAELGVDMPISQAVVAVLEGQLTPPQAVARLMAREAKAEQLV
ncbi:NAD(P)-dependent glycerol-3-phosphate dehydrogenase [Aquincola tertiaricarbonis]|uniref:Glycerol-3-phosphate dehydrogenase [NAD(P)+] n=1 Tax=Aquincola tertiaricarbonis TaxID=391953 RepID=A0ABY4SI23_AQUTE|nr:NAD(P)H-dependent glycerol-3-phosphate dehydrogenase [Aquincola tertiaricarbonis]URI11921.1 NAD(P)-dependent glycerol-3-phosphate dehydrogenase [Aquincola tertiaricarbonis]